MSLLKPNLTMCVGYESTPIDSVRGSIDVLDLTRHYEQFESDFNLQEQLGITAVRYHTMWDKTLVMVNEKNMTGVYDWQPLIPIYESMRKRGFIVTADLCHHKVPWKISDSFAHPNFPELFLDYALQFQAQFPWIKHYALINEAAVTALFHADGTWGKHNWTRVYLNMARAVVLASQALRMRDPEISFYYPEPIDHDIAAPDADREVRKWVELLTDWGRFGMDELLQGKVDEHHGWFEHLVLKNNARPDEVLWFKNNPAVAYRRDLDFYQHCFKMWFRHPNGKVVSTTDPNPPSLVSVVEQYRRRMPDTRLGIGEINIRGTIRDRITFFKWTLEECLKAGVENYCWWGLTDADSWGGENLTREVRAGAADPVGIYPLADHNTQGRLWTRVTTGPQAEFAEIYRATSTGQSSVDDIPAYQFSGEYSRQLSGYVDQHMQHYRFLDPRIRLREVA